MRLGSEWRHVWKQWAGILGDFEKKAVSWDLNLDGVDLWSGQGQSSYGLWDVHALLGQMEQSA